ncbi:hypothetical protein [Campylobacter phage CJLB-10]|nr:hypothetical protein [Campylobacter phage CJLB-10]
MLNLLCSSLNSDIFLSTIDLIPRFVGTTTTF